MHPEFSYTDILKQGLGIEYNEENVFALAKKRSAITEGANTVSTLLGLQGPDGKPYFALDFLVKEFLGLSDQDIETNQKYKEAEILKQIQLAKLMKKQQADAAANTPQQPGGDMGGGMDMESGMNFGSGDVMSGGEFGGPDMGGGMDMGGGETPAPEAPAPEAPAPEGGEGM